MINDPGSSGGIVDVFAAAFRLLVFVVIPILAATFGLIVYIVWPKKRKK